MAKFVPPGFDEASIKAGLYKAMGFGEPTRTEDKAWFYFPVNRASDPTDSPKDQDGVPFDPTVPVATTPRKARVQAACAVEYVDAGESLESFGDIKATRIKITVLDPEYQQIKGFAYVVAGGDKYVRTSVEPPVALGSIDVWTLWCTAEDET